MTRHRCGAKRWQTCSACRGRVHLPTCTTRRRPAVDCCPARHRRLHAEGHTRGLDDAAIPMLGSSAGEPDDLDDAIVAALRDLVRRCDGDEGVRADGSNIQTMQAHAVLKRLDDEQEQAAIDREVDDAEDRMEAGQARWSETGSSRRGR